MATKSPLGQEQRLTFRVTVRSNAGVEACVVLAGRKLPAEVGDISAEGLFVTLARGPLAALKVGSWSTSRCRSRAEVSLFGVIRSRARGRLRRSLPRTRSRRSSESATPFRPHLGAVAAHVAVATAQGPRVARVGRLRLRAGRVLRFAAFHLREKSRCVQRFRYRGGVRRACRGCTPEPESPTARHRHRRRPRRRKGTSSRRCAAASFRKASNTTRRTGASSRARSPKARSS